MRSLHYVPLKILIVGVVISSCGKNDDHDHAENPATSPLYGSWRVLSSTVTGCADPSQDHSIPDCCAAGALCCASIVFTQTTITYSGVTGSSSTYTITGNTYHYPSDGGVPTTLQLPTQRSLYHNN